MATKLSIISSALVIAGDQPLNSLTEDRRAAVVALQLYDSVFETELGKHPWGFARFIIQLNQNITPPKDPKFRYAYQLPSDLLVAVRLIPNEYMYKRYGYDIYSNQPEVKLDYVRKVKEAELPAYFVKQLEHSLALDISISIRDEVKIYDRLEKRLLVIGRNARFQDSQEFPQESITDNPFISTRF